MYIIFVNVYLYDRFDMYKQKYIKSSTASYFCCTNYHKEQYKLVSFSQPAAVAVDS